MIHVNKLLLAMVLLMTQTLISFADNDYIIRGKVETDDLVFAVAVQDYARVKKNIATLKEFKYEEYSRWVDLSSTTKHWGIDFVLYFSNVNKNLRDAFVLKVQDWKANPKLKILDIRYSKGDTNIPGLCIPNAKSIRITK